MDKTQKLPVIRKAASELFTWVNHSYEYLLFILAFCFLIFLGNFLDLQTGISVTWISLSVLTVIVLLTWGIFQKKIRPFRPEQDIQFIKIKIKVETAFFLRLLVYIFLVLFSLVMVFFFFPAQVTYFTYTFYQSVLIGVFFLLLRKRRLMLAHNEPLYAKLSDVLIAYLLFLLFWGTVANAFTFILQFVHMAYIFIKEFLLCVVTLDGLIPWEWAVLILCGTLGLIVSLKGELKKYKESALKKIIFVLPVLFLAAGTGLGLFFFIKKQVLGESTVIDSFFRQYGTELFRDHNQPVRMDQALRRNFNDLSVKTPDIAVPELRVSLPADFNVKLVRAASTYVSGNKVVYGADRILDNNTATCWIAEREATTPELELILKQKIRMHSFIIRNGNQVNRELFFKHNRPGSFILTGYFMGKIVFANSYYLKADSTRELFTLEQGCDVDRLQLKILSQHEGSNKGYCALSDFLIIGFFGKNPPG